MWLEIHILFFLLMAMMSQVDPCLETYIKYNLNVSQMYKTSLFLFSFVSKSFKNASFL